VFIFDFEINLCQKNLIPTPTKALIHRLSEVGHLYKRVENFVRDREGRTGNVGMIEQSLCHHLQEQLTEYYRLIAVLETQMSFSTPDSPAGEGVADGDQAEGLEAGERESGTALTLRRLDVWITEWRLRMRMMSVCVESARGRALICHDEIK
jgi:gamma-tubulin complex component 3